MCSADNYRSLWVLKFFKCGGGAGGVRMIIFQIGLTDVLNIYRIDAHIEVECAQEKSVVYLH